MNALSAFEQHAVARHDFCNRNSTGNGGSRSLCRIRQEERDHSHAALHVAPTSWQSPETARRMVKTDGCRPAFKWTRVRSNHTLAEIRHLQALVAQVALDKFSHRPFEEQRS